MTKEYIENVDEVYNLIMNLMDDEEREFEIKTRVRLSNKMKVASEKLYEEVKQLREELQKVCSHLDYSMTLTGAVCNVCGLEEGDEE